MSDRSPKQIDLWGNAIIPASEVPRKKKPKSKADLLPAGLGKEVKLPVPDFSDPGRKLTCLEADFPIAQINALSNLEGNAGKPIYQMSKWWARRRSSVFRSMLIAAATEAPDDPNEAAKLVWDHYYCNHQKAGSFKDLKVLDCFMGGGTTLVEGSRLGMQMTGVDLNPVAWFVVKNELACSDSEQVRSFFKYVEKQVRPKIQPFYTTVCPRGHEGRWIDENSGEAVSADPVDLPPERRSGYRWEGPEVIYTFWAKHGSCQVKGCGHRTPIFRTPVIAEKKLSTCYTELICPGCGIFFHAELGETRMAPGAERVVAEGEIPFTELTGNFASLLSSYDRGSMEDTLERAMALEAAVLGEQGLNCPECGIFAGKRLVDVLERHAQPGLSAARRRKRDFLFKRKSVRMYLLIHPDWMKGISGFAGDKELGGWAGAPEEATSAWFEKRMARLRVAEVRGGSLPDSVILTDGSVIDCRRGTVPGRGKYVCANCGKRESFFRDARKSRKSLPAAAYALQCHCPQCEAEGHAYRGRYFKAPDEYDIRRLIVSEKEWAGHAEADLAEYWPRQEIPIGERTTKRDSLHDWGYTHWWKMFNSRQLLVHARILKAITEAPEDAWPLDVREQALGAFQQYLRNQNMFAFYHMKRDCLAPALSNSNYYPKSAVVEVSAYSDGYGPWKSTSARILGGLDWALKPWESVIREGAGRTKSFKADMGDPLIPGSETCCGSSTDLSMLGSGQFDLVITDPPFGNNLFYADLADFFYVWLRIPLRRWYADLPEAAYFQPERTPHSMEAVDNSIEHPDEREDYEKEPFIESGHLALIRELAGDDTLAEKDPNPLYLLQPSSDFYSQTLSACWAEAGFRLKDGGIMAFTFHHNKDQAWIDVLRALFDAGYVLVATYPVRSDESKGENAAFGSQKIEYDIIHVCRKRLDVPEPVSWARMRRWVKDETKRLKDLLEHTHGRNLPESDLRVILRGKSLEFYSRHYGHVFTGDGKVLDVRDALLGINRLLDALLEDTPQAGGLRPPDSAEPVSRLYLRLFKNRTEMECDELHKTLRGTGISQGDLEARGWIRVVGRTVCVVPIRERFAFFTGSNRSRKVIRSDLDQAHFLIGAAFPNSGLKIDVELNDPNFRIRKSVDEILKWYARVDKNPASRMAAGTAAQLVERWRTRKDRPQAVQQTLFDQME